MVHLDLEDVDICRMLGMNRYRPSTSALACCQTTLTGHTLCQNLWGTITFVQQVGAAHLPHVHWCWTTLCGGMERDAQAATLTACPPWFCRTLPVTTTRDGGEDLWTKLLATRIPLSVTWKYSIHPMIIT